MRVEKTSIVNGIVGYIEEEVIPKISDDKATQILISIAVNAIRANPNLFDIFLSNSFIKALLEDDGSSTYEIEKIFAAAKESIKKYGAFPVSIPPIPLISPSEKFLKFDENDISEIKRRIERGM